ncbi:MAG: small-conductance mechanosensitive channel, partial [Bradymonadia bacterium]
TPPDAGAAPDFGATPDAGAATDPSTAPDAEVTDAGVGDAQASDAGAPLDPNAQLLPVLEVREDEALEGYLVPGVHPAELRALDDLLETIDLARHRYETLLHHQWEERVQLGQAITDGQALLEQFDIDKAKVAEASTRRVSLAQVERLAVNAHHADIERSLARQRAENDPVDDTVERAPASRLPTTQPPAAISPAAAFETSLARANALRDERTRMLRELGAIRGPIIESARQADKAVNAARAVEKMTAERTFAQRETALLSGLRRLRITVDDGHLAAEALTKTQADATARIIEGQEALETLRLAEPSADLGEADPSPISTIRALRIERAALSERIRFHRAELSRDELRHGIAKTLNDILSGRTPPGEFVNRFDPLLTEADGRARKRDLLIRCDGWRRGRSAIQGAAVVDAAAADRKTRMLESHAALADLCMRHEWVLDAQERLARVARFHLSKQAQNDRNAWWYLWRAVVSLLLLGLVGFATRWIGRITHRLARPPSEEEPAPNRSKTGEPAKLTWKARLARVRGTIGLVLYLGLAGSLWFAASALTVEYVWAHPVQWSTWLGWITHPMMTVADNPVSIWSIFSILMWIVGGLWLARLFQSFLSEGLLDHFAVQRGVRDVVGTLARYLIILLGIIFGLSSAGIPLAALAAVFGVLGIGIGFGLQNIASNFISGFIILIERPFRRGDYIQVGDMVGEVKEIRARATTIETRDAVTVVVPNSEFVTGKVINWTLGHNERLRTQVSVGVAYGSDLQQVTRILIEVGRAHADVLGWPGPRVEMIGFGDSSINFELHVWTRRLRTLPGLRSDLYLDIDARFREEDVTIPFPMRTLLMPKSSGVDAGTSEPSTDEATPPEPTG